MKIADMALAITFLLGIAIFLIVWGALSDLHLGLELGALPLVVSTHVMETLEHLSAKRSLAPDRPTAIYSLHGYGLAWPQIMLFAVPMLVALVQVTAGLAGLLVGMVAQGENIQGQLSVGSFTLGIPAWIIGAYLVGRWIAVRSASHGLVVTIASCAIASVATRAIDYAFIPDDVAKDLYGEQRTVSMLVGFAIFTFLLFLIGSMLGYWRGRHMRMTHYIQYLLGVLPKDSRDTIVNLAYEEAERVAAAAEQPKPFHMTALP